MCRHEWREAAAPDNADDAERRANQWRVWPGSCNMSLIGVLTEARRPWSESRQSEKHREYPIPMSKNAQT